DACGARTRRPCRPESMAGRGVVHGSPARRTRRKVCPGFQIALLGGNGRGRLAAARFHRESTPDSGLGVFEVWGGGSCAVPVLEWPAVLPWGCETRRPGFSPPGDGAWWVRRARSRARDLEQPTEKRCLLPICFGRMTFQLLG